MKIIGTIKDIKTHRIKKDQFRYKKQEILVVTAGFFPKEILLNLWELKIDKYQLQVGEKISAHVNIESKKRGEYWSTSISIWDIERLNLT